MKKNILIAIGLSALIAIVVIPLIQIYTTNNKNIEIHINIADNLLEKDPIGAFQEYDIVKGYLSYDEKKPSNKTYEKVTLGEGKCLLKLVQQKKINSAPTSIRDIQKFVVYDLINIANSNSDRKSEAAALMKQLP